MVGKVGVEEREKYKFVMDKDSNLNPPFDYLMHPTFRPYNHFFTYIIPSYLTYIPPLGVLF